MHKTAFNQQDGLRRDVALALTGPFAGVSGALQLDRPRAARQGGARPLGRRRDRHGDRIPPPPVDHRGAACRIRRSCVVHAEAEAAALGRRRLARHHARGSRSSRRRLRARCSSRSARSTAGSRPGSSAPTSSTGSSTSAARCAGSAEGRRPRPRRQRRPRLHDRAAGGRVARRLRRAGVDERVSPARRRD